MVAAAIPSTTEILQHMTDLQLTPCNEKPKDNQEEIEMPRRK